jgi:hypothetical protein
MNTREFANILHGKGQDELPPGRYALEKYGKPWRVVTVEAVGVAPVAPDVPPVVEPVIVPAAVVVPEVKPALVPVEPGPVLVAGRPLVVNAAMARFMAGKPAAVLDAPESEPASEPAAESMTRAKWRKMSQEARAYHIKHCTELDSDEAVNDWLESLP